MGAVHIELEAFVTERSVEKAYARAKQLQRRHIDHRDPYSWSMLVEGMNRAKARDPKLLLFLDKGADILSKLNDRETSRFAQMGMARCDYGEFSQWREAYVKAMEPTRNEDVMFRVFGWIYAAANEAIR